MGLKVDIRSLSIQLLVLVLVFAIVPVVVLILNTNNTISNDKYDQFEDKIHDVSVMVIQDYNIQMQRDNNAAARISLDPRLILAMRESNTTGAKLIVDEYMQKYPYFDIISVYDDEAIVIARSGSDRKGDISTSPHVFSAINGTEYSVTDIVPFSVIEANHLEEKVVSTGTKEGLAMINALPIRDENGAIMGAVYTAEIQNNNFQLVDTITHESGAYCTIFQGKTRISTTLIDSNGKRIVGSNASQEVVDKVLDRGQVFEGIIPVNNLQLYVHYSPLRNGENQTVGMLFVGYDISPGINKLNDMQVRSLIFGIILSILSVSIGYVMVRSVTRPINKLVNIANCIASGNLDTPVETGARGGEVGDLSNAIKKMVSYMVTNIKDRINFNESILRSISDPMFAIDNDKNITFFNEPAARLTGYTPRQAMGKKCYEIFSMPYCNEKCVGNGCLKEKDLVRGFDTGIVDSDGLHVIIRGVTASVKDANGDVIGAIELLQDITKEKMNEERIKQSLNEKDILLKEIHHRVKNNLQVISSLLSLQSGYVKDKQSLNLFTESQNRVKSMALIHEKLYQSRDLARIDFEEYIKSLTTFLFRSYGVDPNNIVLNIDVEDVSLDIDTAIPCGLIINELVSNSLKYAFPEGIPGEIKIGLHEKMDNGTPYYELTMSDNGIGLPENFDISTSASLGLQLVTTLVGQIGGTLDVIRDHGTTFRIRFHAKKA